jgi:hypothetical protein
LGATSRIVNSDLKSALDQAYSLSLAADSRLVLGACKVRDRHSDELVDELLAGPAARRTSSGPAAWSPI